MIKILISLIVLAGLAAGYFFLQPRQTALEIETISPIVEDISLVLEETGRVVNDRIVKLTSLVNGKIVETRFNVGDHVSANEVVATFDSEETDAKRDKVVAEIERDRHAVENQRLKLNRLEELAKSSGSSQQALDEGRYELKAAEANLRVSESNLRLNEIQQRQNVLKTPYAGIVIEKTSEAGQWMEAGTLLYTLVADEGFEIEVRIDSSELVNVTKNLLTEAYIEDQPEVRWQAPIHWISPSIGDTGNENDNSFAVRLPVTESAPALLLNQQVQISIPLKTSQDAMVLPTNTLLSTQDRDEVAVVMDNKVRRVTVELGVETIDKVEILSGIDSNAKVIIPNGRAMAEGQTVNVTNNP